MQKSIAIEAFGSVAKLAAALGVTRQAVYKMPAFLQQSISDRIRGAALRTGVPLESLEAQPQKELDLAPAIGGQSGAEQGA